MDTLEKIQILSENMEVDEERRTSISTETRERRCTALPEPHITQAKRPGGKTISLLKTMVSSVCEKNCNYCMFRAGRDFRRVTFKPEELAETFVQLEKKDAVDGMFLSSGILDKGIYSQDKIIETAEILRVKKKFSGYLHMKIMPGAEKDQIRELMKYADRVSINLEAPNPERLQTLAPKKEFFNELFTRMKWIHEIRTTEEPRGTWKNRWPSITTQFVVGPANESDSELIQASAYLMNQFKLGRVYYMAFSPVINTPFENIAPENPMREHRLYQSSFLLRDYGFSPADFYYEDNGNLSLLRDPKAIWAEKNLQEAPLEINKASRHELLRVPGIGPLSAKKIMDYRIKNPIRSLEDLQRLGISYEKSGKYLLVEGKTFGRQLRLFV